MTYGKNDDKDTFYKCYTNNVSPIEITVTDNNNNPLSMVTVIYRDIERTTNSAGQVTLPMVANRKEYDVTFKKDGFVNQTVREDVLYSKPTIILNGSSNSSTTTEQPTITTNSEINCTNTGGTSLDGNGNCICNPDEHLVEYKYNEEYSVCRCMNGYHRNGEPNADGKYKATGECIPANDYETTQVPNTEKYRQDAENAYRNEYDNAQSWANKGVTGLSTLMTGEGAKMAAQAWAEQIADRDAETEMADYLAGMRCGYGNGTTLNIGNEDITLPGGNELANYYAEYKTLADKLKTTKAALNLRSGIEAEVLYDRAETGLYQYKIAEIQSGSTPSLSRALMDGESADATAWNAQKTATQNKLITGGVLAATGVVAGYAANQYVNRNHENKYKDLIMTFTEIKKELQIKYPEAFVPEEIPVTPVTEEPIIATIEEILPVIEQPQQATQLDLEPFSDKYLFASGSYKLKNNVSALDDYIQKVIDTLNRPEYADFKICIQIDGHTDRVPPKPGFMSNQALSQKRADSVKDYLDAKLGSIKTHISNITSTGHGEEQCTKDEYKINDDRCRKIDIAIEACNN